MKRCCVRICRGHLLPSPASCSSSSLSRPFIRSSTLSNYGTNFASFNMRTNVASSSLSFSTQSNREAKSHKSRRPHESRRTRQKMTVKMLNDILKTPGHAMRGRKTIQELFDGVPRREWATSPLQLEREPLQLLLNELAQRKAFESFMTVLCTQLVSTVDACVLNENKHTKKNENVVSINVFVCRCPLHYNTV
jgi:hypothetical protein